MFNKSGNLKIIGIKYNKKEEKKELRGADIS